MNAPTAKDIVLRPVTAAEANALVKRVHYSGSFVRNSQLHIGVFLRGRLEGAMQFGPSLDKRKILGLVSGTPWNGFLELNRMAFSDALPRNSESRALGIAMRLIRKHAPHVQWIVSFADGAQCGDGTIYRAAGFVLTQIKRNTSIWEAPNGGVGDDATVKKNPYAKPDDVAPRGAREPRTSLTDGKSKAKQAAADAVVRDTRTTVTKGEHAEASGGGASMKRFIEAGFRLVPGFQLRYLYFLDPTARERCAVPILPFSAIDEAGARMYRGESLSRGDARTRAGSIESNAPSYLEGEGGAVPTPALHLPEVT